MCAGVAELSERWTVDLEVWPIQVQNPSEIFCFYFFIRPRGILLKQIFIIRREYKPEYVFRPKVATNIHLNRKFFPPLFII